MIFTFQIYIFFEIQQYCDFVIITEAISREFRAALPWELLYADE